MRSLCWDRLGRPGGLRGKGSPSQRRCSALKRCQWRRPWTPPARRPPTVTPAQGRAISPQRLVFQLQPWARVGQPSTCVGSLGSAGPWRLGSGPASLPLHPPPPVYTKSRGRRGCVGLCSRHRHSRMRPAARHGGHVSSVSPEAGPPSMCAPSLRPWNPVHGGLGALQLCGRPWTRFGRLRPTPPRPTTSLFCSSQSPLSALNV